MVRRRRRRTDDVSAEVGEERITIAFEAGVNDENYRSIGEKIHSLLEEHSSLPVLCFDVSDLEHIPTVALSVFVQNVNERLEKIVFIGAQPQVRDEISLIFMNRKKAERFYFADDRQLSNEKTLKEIVHEMSSNV